MIINFNNFTFKVDECSGTAKHNLKHSQNYLTKI